jgi:non-specific serine/threonine protein kinase/serine/threonine-protein kinase
LQIKGVAFAEMTPDRFNEIERLYQAALDLRPAERSKFLAESCPDQELRGEVESLLRQRDSNTNVFDRPAVDLAADLLTPQQTMTTVGATVDHYEILSLIGKGGMGEVL